MEIQRVGSRSIVFTYPVDGWNLNVHLIQGKKFDYLIDTGLGSFTMEPVLNSLQDSKRQLVVINTHYHWDHVWGNHVFKNSMMIAHPMCRERIMKNWDTMIKKNGRYMHGETAMYCPNIVFQDMMYLPDDRIRLFYSPGHTLDSISVLDEEDGVLNAGDNIGDTLEEIVPSIETETAIYTDTLMKYKEMDFCCIVSGHNDVLGKGVICDILERLG